MESAVAVGVDIGQKVDPTAIVVVEATRPAPLLTGDMLMRTTQPQAKLETTYTVRELGRLPLGTAYPVVATRIAGVVTALLARGITKPRLVVDATGVGMPVVDILREALRGKPHALTAAMFTHGDRYARDTSDYRAPKVSVGKAYLVSRLQALL